MPIFELAQVSLLSVAMLLACSSASAAQVSQSNSGGGDAAPAMAQRFGHFGDQGNGTYVNAILPADFQNTDVLRVGSYYYYISATKAMSPGMAVLTSDDLIDWKIVGHVIPDITQFSPRFSYDHMDGAQRGVWAGTLAHHAGVFYVYFTTPDEGIFVSTAANPAGPWSPLTCLIKAAGWDDPAPLWDDDGKAYLVTTNFALDPKNGKTYNIHLFQMSSDGLSLKLETDKIIYQSRGSEANKLYKFNGLYYHFFSEVTKEGRVPMIGRAKTIAGPYEIHQLNHVNARTDREPNQGSILQTHTGKWVFITHHGLNEWEGRPASLLPVTWIDGWPVIGRPGPDGIGEMVWGGDRPIPAKSKSELFASDSLRKRFLLPEWEWRYQPRPDAWRLTGRALRMQAFLPLVGKAGFAGVRNVLTQRSARTAKAKVTVKMDLGGLVNGEETGLAHFAKENCRLAVAQIGGVRKVLRIDQGNETAGPVVTTTRIWLRSTWGEEGVARFSYSLDGSAFTEIGGSCRLSWGSYRGDRIGLYTWNRTMEQGHVDFSDFRYRIE